MVAGGKSAMPARSHRSSAAVPLSWPGCGSRRSPRSRRAWDRRVVPAELDGPGRYRRGQARRRGYLITGWRSESVPPASAQQRASSGRCGPAAAGARGGRAVPVRRRRLRDRRHRPGDAARSRLRRAVAVAQVRPNQAATSISGFRRCPAGALRAAASWLAGGCS